MADSDGMLCFYWGRFLIFIGFFNLEDAQMTPDLGQVRHEALFATGYTETELHNIMMIGPKVDIGSYTDMLCEEHVRRADRR